MSKNSRPAANEGTFLQLYLAMQVSGVLAIAGVIIWLTHFYGGYGWYDHNQRFNFHPTFMVIGMVYLAGNSLLIFRVLKTVPKPVVKIIHGSIHVSAFLIALFGSSVVFLNHFEEGKP